MPALGIVLEELLRELQLDPQRDQPLLGAVVQVALDPAPLVLGAGRDAGARELELAQRRLGLGGSSRWLWSTTAAIEAAASSSSGRSSSPSS